MGGSVHSLIMLQLNCFQGLGCLLEKETGRRGIAGCGRKQQIELQFLGSVQSRGDHHPPHRWWENLLSAINHPLAILLLSLQFITEPNGRDNQ